MAEELPKLISLPRPSLKPSLPNGMLQLAVTPEKTCKKDPVRNKPTCAREKKKVCFSEDVCEKAEVNASVDKIQHEYQDLDFPQINSTYSISKQLQKLKTDTFDEEKALKNLQISEQLHSINEKSVSALNFKRKQANFKDLIAMDIDTDKELKKSALKRISVDTSKTISNAEVSTDDIMSFWMPDLVTETAKFDYDKEDDNALLEPNIWDVSSDNLLDFYFCKEIASRCR